MNGGLKTVGHKYDAWNRERWNFCMNRVTSGSGQDLGSPWPASPASALPRLHTASPSRLHSTTSPRSSPDPFISSADMEMVTKEHEKSEGKYLVEESARGWPEDWPPFVWTRCRAYRGRRYPLPHRTSSSPPIPGTPSGGSKLTTNSANAHKTNTS